MHTLETCNISQYNTDPDITQSGDMIPNELAYRKIYIQHNKTTTEQFLIFLSAL